LIIIWICRKKTALSKFFFEKQLASFSPNPGQNAGRVAKNRPKNE
jgi:hypothetical protein